MTTTTTTLIMKYLVTLAAAWLSFGIYNGNPIGWILGFALTGTIINYIIGDLFVLPRFGNIIAAFGDGIMGLLLAYAYDRMTFAFSTTFPRLAVFAILIAGTEFFFHLYIRKLNKVAP